MYIRCTCLENENVANTQNVIFQTKNEHVFTIVVALVSKVFTEQQNLFLDSIL